MKVYLSWLVVVLFLPSVLEAQEAKPKKVPFADRMLPALFNKKIQGDLELAGEQKTEIQSLLKKLEERKDQLGKELQEFKQQGATPAELEDRRKEVVAGFEQDKDSTFTEVLDQLLPHQKKRLQQATVQFAIRQSAQEKKLVSGVLVPELREFLEIEDAQAARIKEKALKLQKELAEKIKKLTEQARSELINELSAKQKRKYKELVGDLIE